MFSKAWIAITARNWIDARFYIACLRDRVDAEAVEGAELRRLEAAYARSFGACA